MYSYPIKLFCMYLLGITFLQYSTTKKISHNVRIIPGAINGVFIEKNGRYLVVYGDPKDELKKADMVLFTDFRRDVIWAGRTLVKNGARAIVPAGEKAYFTDVDSIWTKFSNTRFHDYSNQTTKIETLPIKVSLLARGGENLKWQDLKIKVFDTPGYTRGSVSYIVDIDGKKIAFVGDLIYGDGKILDLYSLQDTVADLRGYHGYAARLGQLISSLQLIAEQKPDIIVPSRGPIINDPDSAILKLIQRVRLVYRSFLSITTIRGFAHSERMATLTQRVLGASAHVNYMPYSPVVQKNPSWDTHISNTNLVFADDGTAFLIDCGTKKETFEEIVKMKQSGRLKGLDGIFITHYHDDHTDFINDFVREFNCPVYITRELKDILENPAAYRMPCLTTRAVSNSNLTVMQEGQKLRWKDFTLTFRYFPGQTLYHDALLCEKDNGEAIFFLGDSFTSSGIDDYCLLNRNLLHRDQGYLYCLDVLKKLPENVLLSNSHVERLFSFSRQQLDYMTNVLLERNAILKDLFPWDDINFGVDEQWARIYPYGQKTSPGKTIECTVKVFNHSDVSKTFILKPNIPNGFSVQPDSVSLVIGPRTEGEKTFKIKISEQISPGISLLTVNIKFDGWDLHEWSESLIEITP